MAALHAILPPDLSVGYSRIRSAAGGLARGDPRACTRACGPARDRGVTRARGACPHAVQPRVAARWGLPLPPSPAPAQAHARAARASSRPLGRHI